MRIPMPFPQCTECGEQSKQAIHRNCGGKLYIYPYSNIVQCSKCDHIWNIWDSTYYCSCGHVFQSKDIKQSLVNLLEACKQCANELEKQQRLHDYRMKISEASLKAFFVAILEKFGYQLGIATGVAIEFLIKLFKT